MSTTAPPATVAPTETKSSRRRKGKGEGAKNASEDSAQSPVAEAGPGPVGVDAPTNGVEGSYESPYIKELYK